MIKRAIDRTAGDGMSAQFGNGIVDQLSRLNGEQILFLTNLDFLNTLE